MSEDRAEYVTDERVSATHMQPRRFRKKPVVITAWQTPEPFDIATLEGTMRADAGDWVITGVKGETYPCKPDIFEATYEEVD